MTFYLYKTTDTENSGFEREHATKREITSLDELLDTIKQFYLSRAVIHVETDGTLFLEDYNDWRE